MPVAVDILTPQIMRSGCREFRSFIENDGESRPIKVSGIS
jgi:hypothetical protein